MKRLEGMGWGRSLRLRAGLDFEEHKRRDADRELHAKHPVLALFESGWMNGNFLDNPPWRCDRIWLTVLAARVI